MKRKMLWSILTLLGGILALFFLWWLISFLFEQGGNFNFPGPLPTLEEVVFALFGEGAGKTYTAIGYSFARLLLGFLCSFFAAIIFGTLSGLFPYFRRFFSPFITVIKAVPTIAVVVLLSSLFFGPDYKIRAPYIPAILAFFVIFPLQYEAIISGFSSISKEESDALKLEGAERNLYSLTKVYYPASLPFLLLSFVQSLGLGLKVVLMAEITVGGSIGEGLGELIRQNSSPILDMEKILAYSVIAIILVLLLDFLLHLLKRKLIKEEN